VIKLIWPPDVIMRWGGGCEDGAGSRQELWPFVDQMSFGRMMDGNESTINH
jgi:hypothetical protein